MISENDYVNLLSENKNLSDDQIWGLRRQYRSMTTQEKKSMDRVYVKLKQKADPNKRGSLVHRNIKNGKKIHKQKTKDNIYVKDSDGNYVKKSEIN